MTESTHILEQLSGSDPAVLREAAFFAADADLMEAVPKLAELLTSSNLGVQEAADNALRKLGGRETVSAVIPLLRSEDAPVRNLSMDILREVGDQDFESLIGLIRDEDGDIRIFAADILGFTDNVLAVGPLCDALLKDPDVNVRYQAAVSLGELGKRDAAACLNKALGDDEWIRFAVIESLAKIKDDSSVGAMIKALDNSSDLVASMIVDALGAMGNIKAAAMLLKKIDEAPQALRNKIAKALVDIMGGGSFSLLSEHERDKFREYLLAALNDGDVEILDAAIVGLGSLGGEDASAAILRTASGIDPERETERYDKAVAAAAQIGVNDSLEAALRSDDPALAGAAVKAAAFAADPSAADLLADVFAGKDRDLQREIMTALDDLAGPRQKDFLLGVLKSHDDAKVLKGSISLLGRILTPAEAGDLLFPYLDHEYDDVKETALEACIAVDGPDMDRRFRDMSADEEPIRRFMAVYALGRLGVDEHADVLEAALKDEFPDIRKIAIEAMGDRCDTLSKRLDLVVGGLQDDDREVRLTVVEILGRCKGEGLVEHLMKALDDPDDWVKVRALDSLGEKRAKESVEVIVPLLESDNKLISLKAVEALGSIGGQSAFRALLNMLNADDPEIVSAAEGAVAVIQEKQGVE